MKLFKRRGAANEETVATVAPEKNEAPTETEAVTDVTTIRQEAAEERQEYDDDAEVAGTSRRGLNPRWSLRSGDGEVTRREVRAAADPESDMAEKLFLKAEHDAEEHGGPGFPR